MSTSTKRKYLRRAAVAMIIPSWGVWLLSLFGGGVIAAKIDRLGIKWKPCIAVFNGVIIYSEMQDDYFPTMAHLIIEGMVNLEMKQPLSRPFDVDLMTWTAEVARWNDARNRLASQLIYHTFSSRVTIANDLNRSRLTSNLKTSFDIREAVGGLAEHRLYSAIGSNFVVASGWLCVFFTLLSLLVLYKFRPYPRGHCQECNYNLTDNTTGTCPECGTTIAPAPVKNLPVPQKP